MIKYINNHNTLILVNLLSEKQTLSVYFKYENLMTVIRFLAHLLQINIMDVLCKEECYVSQNIWQHYSLCKQKLLSGIMPSKILMHKAFWDCDFFVNQHVLDPRPETELIIQQILNLRSTKLASCTTLLDLGIGSGCISVTLLKLMPELICTGIDIDHEALSVARINAQLYNISHRLLCVCNSWADNMSYKYDCIVANPPYLTSQDAKSAAQITSDPLLALDGGADGLSCYMQIFNNIQNVMHEKTIVLLEISHYISQNLQRIIRERNMLCDVIKDYRGYDRILIVSY